MGVLGEKPVPTQFPERAKVEILRERCLGNRSSPTGGGRDKTRETGR
jgi:hypothetical protein